jgi:hypothetical protein
VVPGELAVALLADEGDEQRFVDGSRRRVASLPGGVRMGRGEYRPGWRWSEHAAPLSGRPSAAHTGYVISGRLAVETAGGERADVGPGQGFAVGPGHDAWVLGDEPCVALDVAWTNE